MLAGIFWFCAVNIQTWDEECFIPFETQAVYFCPGPHDTPYVNPPSDGVLYLPDGRSLYFDWYSDGPSQRYFAYDPDLILVNGFGRCQAEASGR